MKQAEAKPALIKYRILLACAAAAWGLGFPIGKSAIAIVGATWFTGLRFLGAGIVLAIIFSQRIRKHLTRDLVRSGIIIGIFSFFGFWTQFIGLGLTTPSKNAFLSACYCVTVPFLWWVIKRARPSKRVIASALCCVVGIGFVSLDEGFSIGLGDSVSVLSAFVYGGEIVAISMQMKDHDPMAITVVQQFTGGLLALVCATVMQPLPDASVLGTWSFIGPMIYVVFVSAAFGAVAQNIAQSKLSASESGLLCSLESVFCALFSVFLFGEVLTGQMLIGFALIFAAVVGAQVEPASTRRLIERITHHGGFTR